MSETKTVKVSEETHQALTAMGRKGESYDAIIGRLLLVQREYEETGGLRE